MNLRNSQKAVFQWNAKAQLCPTWNAKDGDGFSALEMTCQVGSVALVICLKVTQGTSERFDKTYYT